MGHRDQGPRVPRDQDRPAVPDALSATLVSAGRGPALVASVIKRVLTDRSTAPVRSLAWRAILAANGLAPGGPWWLAAGRAFALGLVGSLVVIWFVAFPAPFLHPGWPLALLVLAGLGVVGAMVDRRPVALGSLVLGVAAAVSVDLLVVVRSAGVNGPAFIDPSRTPEAWRTGLTGDLQLGLLVAGAAWLVVAGGLTVLAPRRRVPEPGGQARVAWVAAVLLAGVAFVVGLWGLPAFVAEASRTQVVLPAAIQRVEVTLHADSTSITPATVHPGDIWTMTSTNVPFTGRSSDGPYPRSLDGPYGPLTDAQVSGLPRGPFDPTFLNTLPRPGRGAHDTVSFETGRYVWLVTRWANPETMLLEDVATLTVDSSPAPVPEPAVSADAPLFGAIRLVVLAATGLAFAALAAGSRRPRAVARNFGLRLVWVALLGVGVPLLLAGLMDVFVEFVRNPL